MIKNYLKIALRYFWRNRVYTIINISGLAVALTICILMILYVQDELSFDTFHPNNARIYQVYNQRSNPSYPNQTSHQLAPLLAQMPEIEAVARGFELGRTIKIGDKKYNTSLEAFDGDFFRIFNFKLLKGNPKTALLGNNSVVLSENAAIEYFGTINILNRKILYETEIGNVWDTLVVKGVIENCPPNSSILYNIIIPYPSFLRQAERADFPYPWLYNASTTFVLTKATARRSRLEAKISQLYRSYVRADSIRYLHTEGEMYNPAHQKIRLLPLKDFHLNPQNLKNQSAVIKRQSSWRYSYIFTGISMVLLLVACFNFTNLSLMQYLHRSREIGLRKALGASRRDLIAQFYSEVLMLNLVAMSLAIGLSYVLMPTFNALIAKELYLNIHSILQIFAWLAILLLLSTFLAGLYPALVFSSYQVSEFIKGNTKIGFKNRFSAFLVILQFAIAITFIAIMLIMNWQLNFLRQKYISQGRDLNDVFELYPQTANEILNKTHLTIKNQIAQIKGVKNISITFTNSRGRTIEGLVKGKPFKNTIFNCLEADYIATLRLKIVAGQDFRNLGKISPQKYPVLVNRAFVRRHQLKNPLGEELKLNNLPEYNFVITGVVQDYVNNFDEKALPEILIYNNPQQTIDKYPFYQFYNWTIRIDPAQQNKIFPAIERVFNQNRLSNANKYHISMQKYMQESLQPYLILPQIVYSSSVIPILVALMGLVGITSFSVSQRTKEIGIRKTLGASSREIMFFLAFDFQKLVLISMLIALPLVGSIAYIWLQNFAYTISTLAILLCILGAGLAAFGLSLVLLLLLVYEKAQANPVESLRYE
ncbi:MAG: ABC transporter permease [Microscillaceae bacterium]|jgi:putative ABC transport system permease protein|nr:ABC transporter permease [Microscillaceae bacterium]